MAMVVSTLFRRLCRDHVGVLTQESAQENIVIRARMIYESMFGNTAAVAEAIAPGLREYAEVEVVNVLAAAEVCGPTLNLLVVGGPTHAFGLSRPQTRRDAAKLTDAPIATDIGVGEWLAAAPPVSPRHRAWRSAPRSPNLPDCPARPHTGAGNGCDAWAIPSPISRWIFSSKARPDLSLPTS